MNTLQHILESKIVAVIRGANPDEVVPIAKALSLGGIKTLEITAETRDVLSLIKKASTELNEEIIVGAGTVLDPETARSAIMAGAKFIFSPTVNLETIRMTKRYGGVSIPGALTPTEILTAYENGADIVKVFPADVLGPGYLKDVHGPLPQIPLMPTGGVNLENISDYFKAGAVAVGLGGALVDANREITSEYLDEITKTASRFTKITTDLL